MKLRPKKENMAVMQGAAIASEHLFVVESVKEIESVLSASQVIRWAINALRDNSDVFDDIAPPYFLRLSATTVEPRQKKMVQDMAKEMQCTSSQIIRNAIKALAIKYNLDYDGEEFKRWIKS